MLFNWSKLIPACLALGICVLIPGLAQAQARPANQAYYSYPPSYDAVAPRPFTPYGRMNTQPAPYYGRTYTSYYGPDLTTYSPPGSGTYSYPDTLGVDPWFRSAYYSAGPANYMPWHVDYYASPRYFNYYYPGWMR